MWIKRLMWIVWPAFLAAGVIEMLVFTAFDPQDMQWLGRGVQLTRAGIYTVAFFAFWLVLMGAGYLTILLSLSNDELNTQASPT